MNTYKYHSLILSLAALFLSATAVAQTDKGVTVTGSLQSDMMIAPQQDSEIGTSEYDNRHFLTNTYAEVMLQSKYVDAGLRGELKQFPMPGFASNPNEDFKGWGIANLWAKLKLNKVEVTAGSFYEQFGSGFVLRTYEERSLGVDNSLFGGRIITNPFKGVQLKVLSGVQKNYWNYDGVSTNFHHATSQKNSAEWQNTHTLVSGADLELSLEDWIKPWANNGTHLTLGGSWVNKYESEDYMLGMQFTDANGTKFYDINSPKFVNAFDARVRFQKDGFNVLAEYAHKSADPNSVNGGIFRKGYAAMLSASYSKKGLSILAQVKRSDNMTFRSKRGDTHTSTGYINHMPAFTLDHTYALAALYPYATQPDGEWAYQASVGYNFKRKTALGGKYGTKLKLNYSRVHGIVKNQHTESAVALTDGYGSPFWKHGDALYEDVNVQLEKKLSKSFDLHFMYMYQQYNRLVEGHDGNIYSHIFVGEGKWRMNKKLTLRAEAQYLHTKHESGDWGFGLLELSVAPYLMFTVSDQIGRPEIGGEYGKVAHYYTAAVTGNYKSHRLMLSYGRTRAGYNCTGGVCRYIPASKGFTINYNYNF